MKDFPPAREPVDPASLRRLPDFYRFTSDKIRKVVDSEGVVHDTEWIRDMTYRRRTLCDSQLWSLVEPVVPVSDDAVVTCITCLGTEKFDGVA